MGLGTDSVLDSIVHPDLLASMPRVYAAIVTIQAVTESQADDYSVIQAWENVSGMVAIRGSLVAAKAEEIRKLTHVCDLAGYYPTITASHQALIALTNGEMARVYNISGVKLDSQAASTRLELEIVSY